MSRQESELGKVADKPRGRLLASDRVRTVFAIEIAL
jgi:hypothetical protein